MLCQCIPRVSDPWFQKFLTHGLQLNKIKSNYVRDEIMSSYIYEFKQIHLLAHVQW